MLLGMALGFVVGLLPGLGGPTTLALMLPFVFKMTPIEAFAFLLGMLSVTATTGDITSILFGISGEPTTAATIVDGHAMARNGEAGRALGVFVIGHRHAPVGHGAIGIEQRHLTEGALGLEVPEAMKLADALLEELLRLGGLGADWKANVACLAHEVGFLPRAFVEDFAVIGSAVEIVGVIGLCRDRGEQEE